MTYPDTRLFIDGQWQDARDGRTLAVHNPATGQEIGCVAHAAIADLDLALASAQKEMPHSPRKWLKALRLAEPGAGSSARTISRR